MLRRRDVKSVADKIKDHGRLENDIENIRLFEKL
jgi:hypothetical protein